jgi:hypothetical protein
MSDEQASAKSSFNTMEKWVQFVDLPWWPAKSPWNDIWTFAELETKKRRIANAGESRAKSK